jgi:hypothetical protein
VTVAFDFCRLSLVFLNMKSVATSMSIVAHKNNVICKYL